MVPVRQKLPRDFRSVSLCEQVATREEPAFLRGILRVGSYLGERKIGGTVADLRLVRHRSGQAQVMSDEVMRYRCGPGRRST
eukprot:COSAG01_NODE_4388_length_5076_cov_15.659232_5_plen_82_part_00